MCNCQHALWSAAIRRAGVGGRFMHILQLCGERVGSTRAPQVHTIVGPGASHGLRRSAAPLAEFVHRSAALVLRGRGSRSNTCSASMPAHVVHAAVPESFRSGTARMILRRRSRSAPAPVLCRLRAACAPLGCRSGQSRIGAMMNVGGRERSPLSCHLGKLVLCRSMLFLHSDHPFSADIPSQFFG